MVRVGSRVQNAVEDRPDEQDAKRIEQPTAGHQQHGGEQLPPVGQHVPQQALQLLHGSHVLHRPLCRGR